MLFAACEKSNSQFVSSDSASGQGGSLARFTIVNNHLYIVDQQSLHVYDISTPSSPQFQGKTLIGFNIEAIFPFQNKLFIASNAAMYIYNINTPSQPVFESNVEHLSGCDPIVANDSIAFLTVHGGNACRSTINELFVYDISNINSPLLIDNIPMTNPFGLALKDQTLYVCDNGEGLKVFDVSDPHNLSLIRTVGGENFVDLIPRNNTLLAMLTDGIGYYDISDATNPQKLSVLKN